MRETLKLTILLLFALVACKQNVKPESIASKENLKTSYVSDLENILSEEEIDTLSTMIHNFKKETTNEIKIVTTSSISPFENYNDYSVDLFNKIGIGLKEKNNGLLLTLSKKLKFTRITTGTGTKNILTNDICLEIVNELLIPNFRENNFYRGIKMGLSEIMNRWK